VRRDAAEGAPLPPPRRHDFARLATALLLILAAAVLLERSGRLLVRGTTLDAQDEARWLGWAWRRPDLADLFTRIDRRLAPGEPVVLLVPVNGWPDEFWVAVMARYHLAGHAVLEVRRGRLAGPAPPGTAVVRILSDGRIRIRRPGESR
jgi:hypothetical protein